MGMAISKNGVTIFALLATLVILETDNFIEFSCLVSPEHDAVEDFLPHSRQRRNAELAHVEYEVEVELNVTDVGTVDYLRSLLNNGSLSLALGPKVNVTHIDITTVCYPNSTNFQCICEDQYVWSYTNCITYGACDPIINDTCRCINSIPTNGEYCQPKTEVFQLYTYLLEVEISVSDIALIGQLDTLERISFPVRVSNTVNITQIDIIFTVPPVMYEYQIFIEVNTTDADQLRNTLEKITFPVQASTLINISSADITTVCSQDGTGFQCHCEDDFFWPCDSCVTYGKCDGDTNDTCSCIRAIPTDGQYCQSIHNQNLTACPLTTTSPSTAPPVVYEYLISIELNISDVTVIDQLRTILTNISYPISINNHIQISDVNISTVCSPNSGGFQCKCEDQYQWSCDQCLMYGSCDNITYDTCGCINAIPPHGQFCQPVDRYNFTSCPQSTPSTPTTPPVVYEYLISIELNISDVTVIDQLRTILTNISYPISISNHIQISDVNISTVCSPNSGGFQCKCEDQYQWSCDQCLMYGSCDNITYDTCGCINAIPPHGQFCQPVDRYNFTACPQSTPSTPTTPPVVYEYLISIELNISDVTVIDQLRTILTNISYPISINNHIQISDVNITTVCSPTSDGFQCKCEDQYRWSCGQCLLYGSCDNITSDTCGCINAIPPDGQYCQPVDQYNFTACPLTTTTTPAPTTSPVIYEYLISFELNISDVTLITQLRTILSNISYPISINNHIQISDVNITTVCYPNGTTYQCRCEEQFRWPCHLCSTFGKCSDKFNNSCGCINAIPPDGFSCQPLTDLFICPSPTPPDVTTITAATTPITTTTFTPTPTVTTDSVSTTDVNTTTVGTPTTIVTNSTHFATTDVNTTIATTPTTVTNSTTAATMGANTTMFTTSPTTTVTNSTSVATTDMNTTTVATPTTIVTNSTTIATTDANMTSSTTTPTTVTNSTPVATTHLNTTTPTTAATTVVTNSTHFSTTDMNTTTAGTPPPTVLTFSDSTTVATTVVNTTIVATTPTTTVTNTTPVATTNRNTTTAVTPTTIVTTINVTSQQTTITTKTSEAPTTSHTTISTIANTTITTTPATTTNTTVPTTTITMASTTTPTSTTTTAFTATPNTTTTTASTATPTTTTTTASTTTPTTTTTTASTPTTTTTTASTATPTTTTPTTASTGTPTTTTTTASTTTPTTTTTTATTTTPTTTTTTTTSTISTTTATTIAPTGFNVEMSITFDKEYTAALNDQTSAEYRELESSIRSVLNDQYKGITGYINVFVRGFREGSIITDFVVQTTQLDPDELANVNQELPDAMRTIAPVIGSVSAFYKSPTPISIPDLTYTGNTMTLKCRPPEDITVGQISSSVWKFKGREIKNDGRMEITTSNDASVLNVNNVIPADSGLYRCTLRGKAMDFLQQGVVTEANIKQAPIVRLRSEVNIRCEENLIQPLECCVQPPFKVMWFQNEAPLNSDAFIDGGANCIEHDYTIGSCSGSQEDKLRFICRVEDPPSYEMTTTMTIFREDIKCDDAQYGVGREGDRSTIGCAEGQEGSKTAICRGTGKWELVTDTCIVTEIKELLIDSQDLVEEEVPQFVANLSKTVEGEKTKIANSSATISAVVDILNTVATITTAVNETVMQNIIATVDVIIGDDARESWVILNANETSNASSQLLGSLESLSNDLVGEFSIKTARIQLDRTTFNNSFNANLNSSVIIDIPSTNMNNVFITTIILSTLNNVMPTRNSTFDASLFNATSNETVSDSTINAAVVLVKINATIQNVSLSYDKLNSTLILNPQCVFWNFTIFNNLGAWDDKGCEFVSDLNDIVTCSCNHLTSFSILMATDIPPSLREALDIITYVGVGISLASLVICLIIEGYVWKAITKNSTAFMRHVSIVNTALSLLIADICFIIGASIAKNPLENPGEDYEVPLGPCSTATFFMHFFYLALFFWMLVSGLLLFYRTVMVFSHMSKSTMLAIGFCLGYGGPLIIAVITVAVTAPRNGYIREKNACWLNWNETKALLAMVIPALTIVFINILIVIVVLFKMLRRGVADAAQRDERHTLVVIARCVIILTPLFGLTWSLGVGTMVSSTNKGIHIAFAFFNSLQGFFILVFGTLFDSKIRSILSRRVPTTSSGTGSNSTRSTSGGISSFSGTNLISRLLGRRYMYHVSQATNSNSSGATESYVHI